MAEFNVKDVLSEKAKHTIAGLAADGFGCSALRAFNESLRDKSLSGFGDVRFAILTDLQEEWNKHQTELREQQAPALSAQGSKRRNGDNKQESATVSPSEQMKNWLHVGPKSYPSEPYSGHPPIMGYEVDFDTWGPGWFIRPPGAFFNTAAFSQTFWAWGKREWSCKEKGEKGNAISGYGLGPGSSPEAQK
jgi:hypothetical protein